MFGETSGASTTSDRNRPNCLFRTLSIRTKLVLLATTSVAIALILAFAGLATNDIGFIRKSKIDQLQSQARMLAFNCAGVLTFQDEVATHELLASVSMYPTVEYACVFDEDGRVFAEYSSVTNKSSSAPVINERQSGISEFGVEVVEPVNDGGERIGTIYLRANMSDLKSHIQRYLMIGTAIMIGALIVAGLLSLFLQRSISDPINQLAIAANTVKDKRDFSVRVTPMSNDELGELSITFNNMLDEIQVSKAALQTANAQLEERVEQRTAQLTNEIEQRKSVQLSLEIARDEAEAASRAKSEFLANMSHEIRTPLNGILGFAEILTHSGHGISSEQRNEYLETISSSGRHLLELINDILDLSKIEAGQLDVELSPCSPHEVINQVVSVLRARAQQKGLQLKCEWVSSVPETITTDGGRLRQLLMNLVGNAIKFTDEGSVTINAELDHIAEQLTIRVVDTGIGISKEKQNSIFDPFVQADNSVTRRYGGTGLGLAISQRLSAALGGDLQVKSEDGLGSVFTLRVNTGSLSGINLVDAPSADALMTSAEKQDETNFSLANRKILLVEDGAVNRKLVKIMLEDAGARVTTCENGWVGVQHASKDSFDLILMDMQMPVMDGYTATKKLRESGLEVPILALTAHAMMGDEQKCLDAGCTAYLTKPIQKTVLISTICAHLADSPVDADLPADVVNSEQPESQITDYKSLSSLERKSDPRFVSSLPLDNPVYQEIVVEFVEFLGQHVRDMQAAYQNQEFDNLAELAHALKGAGGTAGFDALTEPAWNLQRSAKEPDSQAIEQALTELTSLAKRISETPQSA